MDQFMAKLSYFLFTNVLARKKSDGKKHKKTNLKIISFGDEEIIESPIRNESLISTFLATSTEVSKLSVSIYLL